MGLLQKLKDSLDWGKRIEFFAKVIGLIWALLAGETMKAIIASFTHLPDVWHMPLYLAASCLALIAFVAVLKVLDRNRKKKLPEHEDAKIISDVKLQGGKALLLSFMEARAIELHDQLEALWHHWDNAGEKLIHPLDARLDTVKNSATEGSWGLIYERRDFMVLYACHLSSLKAELPEFTSAVVSTGYPSDCEYHQVLANLKAHIRKLRVESSEAWDKY